MAQKYYSMKEAAKALGMAEAEVKQLLDRRKLHGYRDGADWKFKTEDIDRFARERPAEAPASGDEDGDVLMSEIELGASDPGLSGTVIGGELAGKKPPIESDLKLADSEIQLADDGIELVEDDAPAAHGKAAAPAAGSQFDELDLTLDEDPAIEPSGAKPAPKAKAKPGDSAVDLTGKALDDDDLVLGGSGTGSDITIGGDSGISLVDPADSGLSLEEPLGLSAAGEESLELGEDDLLSLASDTGIGGELKPSESDFQLTPSEEADEGEDSESGSQVIALDTEGEGDDAATMIGGGAAALLDEDLSTEPFGVGGMPMTAPGMASAAAMTGQTGDMTLGGQPAVYLPEAPYTIWNIVGLALCTLVLILVGMMMYDLLQNMWTWERAHPLNSPIMDTILGWFEK